MENNNPPQLTDEAREAAACEKSFFARNILAAFDKNNPDASAEARKKATELAFIIAGV